jgi:hypothetical protein
MFLKSFAFVSTVLHLSWAMVGSMACTVHTRIQQRRTTRLLVAAPPIQTIDLLPAEVELSVEEPEQPANTVVELVLLPVPNPLPAAVAPGSTRLPDWGDAEPMPPVSPVQPTPDRNQMVIALLDEAYAQGHTTYADLIGYVRAQTGTGCSRRVVAAWKKTRKLVTADGEAA